MRPRCPPRGAACPCQPLEARRGQLLSPPLGLPERRGAVGAPPQPPPPEKGEAVCRTDVAGNPASFPLSWVRGWPAGRGAVGRAHPPSCAGEPPWGSV